MIFRFIAKFGVPVFVLFLVNVSGCKECRRSSECASGEICKSGWCESTGHTFVPDTGSDSNPNQEFNTDDVFPDGWDTINPYGTDNLQDSDSTYIQTQHEPFKYIDLETSEFDPDEVYFLMLLDPHPFMLATASEELLDNILAQNFPVVAHWSDPEEYAGGLMQDCIPFNAQINPVNLHLTYLRFDLVYELGIDMYASNELVMFSSNEYNDSVVRTGVAASADDPASPYQITEDGSIWVTQDGEWQVGCPAGMEFVHAGENDRCLCTTTSPANGGAFSLVSHPGAAVQLDACDLVQTAQGAFKAAKTIAGGFWVAIEMPNTGQVRLMEVMNDCTEAVLGDFPEYISYLDMPTTDAPHYAQLDGSAALFIKGTQGDNNRVVRQTIEGENHLVYSDDPTSWTRIGIHNALITGP